MLVNEALKRLDQRISLSSSCAGLESEAPLLVDAGEDTIKGDPGSRLRQVLVDVRWQWEGPLTGPR